MTRELYKHLCNKRDSLATTLESTRHQIYAAEDILRKIDRLELAVKNLDSGMEMRVWFLDHGTDYQLDISSPDAKDGFKRILQANIKALEQEFEKC